MGSHLSSSIQGAIAERVRRTPYVHAADQDDNLHAISFVYTFRVGI